MIRVLPLDGVTVLNAFAWIKINNSEKYIKKYFFIARIMNLCTFISRTASYIIIGILIVPARMLKIGMQRGFIMVLVLSWFNLRACPLNN